MTDIEISTASASADAAPASAPSASLAAESPEQLAGSAVLTVYSVYGMSCGHCASAVTREISAIDGVTGVHVDLGAKRVTVGSTHRLSEDDVRSAVDEAGYELG